MATMFVRKRNASFPWKSSSTTRAESEQGKGQSSRAHGTSSSSMTTDQAIAILQKSLSRSPKGPTSKAPLPEDPSPRLVPDFGSLAQVPRPRPPFKPSKIDAYNNVPLTLKQRKKWLPHSAKKPSPLRQMMRPSDFVMGVLRPSPRNGLRTWGSEESLNNYWREPDMEAELNVGVGFGKAQKRKKTVPVRQVEAEDLEEWFGRQDPFADLQDHIRSVKGKGKGKAARCETMEVDEFSYGAWKRDAERRAEYDREGMLEATEERFVEGAFV